MSLRQIENLNEKFDVNFDGFNGAELIVKDYKIEKLIKANIDMAIKDAMEKLNERKSFFSEDELLAETKAQLKERVRLDENLNNVLILNKTDNGDIKERISEFLIKGEIVKSDEKLTSKEFYGFEQTILDYKRQPTDFTQFLLNSFGKGGIGSAIKKWEDKPENYALSGDQRRALEAMLTNEDSYLIVQGHAGTGKTSVMKAYKDILTEAFGNNGNNGYVPVKGLAMTGKAATELEDDSGIESYTVKSFLGSHSGVLKAGNTIIIDEAGLLPTKKLAEVVKIAKEKNCKIVLCGDVKQHGSIEAGGMFKELQERCKTVELTTIRRQKDELLLDAVKSMADKNVSEAFEKLKKEGNIYTISDADKLKANVVSDYTDKLKSALADNFAKDIKAGAVLKMVDISRKDKNKIFRDGLKKSVILTSNDADKDALNNLVREKLKKEGILKTDKNTCRVDCLQPVDMMDFDKKRAKNYKEGDIIKSSAGEKDDKSYKVISTNEKDNFIYAENIATRKIEKINPGVNLDVFKERNKDFCVNDKITFLKDYDNAVKGKDGSRFEIKEGHTAIIKDVSEDNAGSGYIIKAKINGEDAYFNTKNYNAIDYSYAMTSMQSQCISADNVFVYNNGETNYNEMYVDMTRAKKNLKIYTADEEKMINDAKKEQAQEAFSSKSKPDIFKIKPDVPAGKLKTWQDFVNDEKGNKANADLAYTSYLLNKDASKNSIYRKLVSESDVKERHDNPDKYITGVIEEAKKNVNAQHYKKSVTL